MDLNQLLSRASSFQYLVPLTVASTANPSLSWSIHIPGATDIAPCVAPPFSPVAAAVVWLPNSQPELMNALSYSGFSNTNTTWNFFAPSPNPAWISPIFI